MRNRRQECIYCDECGEELIRVPVLAEKAIISDYSHSRLGSRFNEKTGMRQFGIKVFCINYKSKWYGNNGHTSFIDRDSLHDSDLPELLAMK